MTTLWQDVRYGARVLLSKPGFTLIAMLALALGIGANSAIFSVVNTVLLRPLPFDKPEQLMFVNLTNPEKGISSFGVSLPDFREWRDRNQVFEHIAAMNIQDFNLSAGPSGDTEPERISGATVSADFFSVLRLNPAEGRVFSAEEEQFGNHRVVVLSHAVWQQRFGGRHDLIGQPITLNGETFTVIGIMPPGFQFPDSSLGAPATGLWTPLAVDPSSEYNTRGNYWLSVMARLKPGVSEAQAGSNMTSVMEQLQREVPDLAGMGVRIVSLRQATVGSVETALWILLAAVGFVLLIACANVANLLLARATARQKEIAVRTALGASRGRIVRQLLTESMMLGLSGGALGILLALWSVDLLARLSSDNLPRAGEIKIDIAVVAFTLAVSLLTSLIFGLAPALHASRVDLNESLSEGGRGSSAGGGRRLRGALVAAEIALSLVLLIGAGLMINSFLRLQNVNPGFKADHVLTMQMTLPQARYPDARSDLTSGFFQQLIERVRTLPGVESAAVTSSLPLVAGGWGKMFTREDRPAPASMEEVPLVQYRQMSSDYFNTLKVPLMKGRFFSDEDNNSKVPVAILNETAADRFFEGEDPIGKVIKLGPPEEMIPPGIVPPGFRFPRFTIVGVVADVKHYGLDQGVRPEVYTPHAILTKWQDSARTMFLAMRTTGDPMTLVGAVRSQVLAIDKDQPISQVASMESLLSTSLAQPRFSMLLLGIFAGVALVLAAVGVYGVMSYSVTQRTREIGIRIALGARSEDVFKIVVREGMTVALIGIVIGLAGALAVTRVMATLLFGVTATDPLTFAAVSVLLTGVALGACFVPARRAAKVDPMVALRYE